MLILTLLSVICAFLLVLFFEFMANIAAINFRIFIPLYIFFYRGLFIGVFMKLFMAMAISLSLLIKYNNFTKKTSLGSMINFKLKFTLNHHGVFSGVDDFGALQNFDYVEDLIFFGVLSIPLIAFGCWKIISWRNNPPKTNMENEIWQEYRAADYVAIEPETEINYMRQRTQFYDHMDISNFPYDIKYPKVLSHEILEKLNGDCSVVSEVHRNIVFMSCLNECARLEIPLTESGYKYFLFWLKTHDLTSCLAVYPKHFETVMVYITKYEKTLGYWEKVERVPVDSVNGARRNCYSFEKALDNIQDKNIKNTEIPEITNVISPLAKIMQTTHPTTFNLIIGKPPSVMSREVLIFMYNHCEAFDYYLRYQTFINAVVQLKRKNVPLDRSGYDYLNEWCDIHKKNLREFEHFNNLPFYSKEFIDMLAAFLEGLSF